MVSTCFQLFIFPAQAAASEDDSAMDADAQPAPSADQTLIPGEIRQAVSYDEFPGGSVESYSSMQKPLISSSGDAIGTTHLSSDGDTLRYYTAFGTYLIDQSNPQYVSLIAPDGTLLVRESIFTIISSQAAISITDGKISESTNESLQVIYDITDTGKDSALLGKMQLQIDFGYCSRPKFTATVLEINESLTDWQVVWQITPPAGSSFTLSTMGGGSFALDNILDSMIETPDLATVINLPSKTSKDAASFIIDWSDAKQGLLSSSRTILRDGGSAISSMIYFEKGKSVIDPTMVSSVTGTNPTEMSSQRKTFWYDSWYWAFYNRSDGIYYRNSADGQTWSSEIALPSGTMPSAGTGFDVSQRNGIVAVGWRDNSKYQYFEKGTILGNKITWSSRVTVASNVQKDPVSVAIGTDMTYWITYTKTVTGGNKNVIVARSFDGSTFTDTMNVTAFTGTGGDYTWWCVLLPFSNGNLALLELQGSSNSARVRYYLSSANGWNDWYNNPYTCSISILSGDKSAAFSAIASLNGTINIAYNRSDSYLGYARVYYSRTFETFSFQTYFSISNPRYPSISLDGNGFCHIYYLAYESSKHVIKHFSMSQSSTVSGWYGPDLFYTAASGTTLKGLTSWGSPITISTMEWTETTASTKKVMFGSIPLPYGTPGAPSAPWSRLGLSPYGTYFQMSGGAISPGSGLLTLTQGGISVPGRNGIDLGFSFLYQQPKYSKNSDGSPCDPAPVIPWQISLGQFWSIDLPWRNADFVCLPGGQRFLIQWGNTGSVGIFENHIGTDFTLRQNSDGSSELFMSSGIRYEFSSTQYRLVSISDEEGYNPLNSASPDPYNRLDISYGPHGGGYMTYMTDSCLSRYISFTYGGSGFISQITQPDGKTINITYTQYNGKYYLTSISDPKIRYTNFTYNASADYCLNSITYPTGSRVNYTYLKDNTSGTEVRTWLIVKEVTKVVSTGALIRQTSFDYKIVNGKIIFTKRTDRNETGTVQGFTEYIFQDQMGLSKVTEKDAAGAQMMSTRTWYGDFGKPIRVDTYKGNAAESNYSEYITYDNWGNVIFKKDALGSEIYCSFANTTTQESFQGGIQLSKTASGKLLYDTFDDWDFSDWSKDVGAGFAEIYSNANTPNSPVIHVQRNITTGNAFVYKTFTTQTNNFYMQSMFNTSRTTRSYIVGISITGYVRIYFSAYNGNFQYYDGSAYTTVAPCELNKWYDVGFFVRYSNNTYDIYIDGVLKKCGAPLLYSGSLNQIRFQAGYVGATDVHIWFDNVRVYKNLNVGVSLTSGYLAKLYDSKNNLISWSNTGTLTIPAISMYLPGHIILSNVGRYSISSPILDVWGGDNYSMSEGVQSSPLSIDITGLGCHLEIVNDAWPAGSTYYESQNASGVGDGSWVTDPSLAVYGQKYHQSAYLMASGSTFSASHYHGYNLSSGGTLVAGTKLIKQYIWLTDGKIPYEIMLQFCTQASGIVKWHRVYWGGSQDVVNLGIPQFTPISTTRMGDVPQITGKWLQLTINLTDLNLPVGFGFYVRGILYGLYGGTARWDSSGWDDTYSVLDGVPLGQTVKIQFDNGATLSAQSYGDYTDLYLRDADIKVFPASGIITIWQGNNLIYASHWLEEMYLTGWYTYEYSGQTGTPEFYPNQIKAMIHNRPVATFQYQNVGKTISQKNYFKYNFEGNLIESKSKLGGGWTYSQAGYDQYGSMLWSSDPTGRRTINEYSSTYGYAYKTASSYGGLTDTFDLDTSWSAYKAGSGGYTYWFDAKYSTEQAYSGSSSTRLNFSNAPGGYDTCTALMYKEYNVNQVAMLSVRMYLATYSHNNNSAAEYMHSGICMRLYNSNGVNYANYTYWLTCWSYFSNNATTADPNIKVICGKPTMNTWISRVLYPSADWNINWGSCDKVRFELFVQASYAVGDSFKVYYDDFTYDDFAKNSKSTFTYGIKTGNLLSSTDPLGHQTSTQYDVLGRAIRANNSDGTYRTITFDDKNNKLTTLDELNHKTIQYFDTIGRLIKVERYNGSTYYSSVNSTYNWQDKLSASQDALGRVTKTTYDYLGRPIKIINPDNTNRTIAYNNQANLVTFTDENGHTIVQVLDDIGRLNATREYYSASSYYETKMAYDAVGNLLTVRASNGNVTRMSYDYLNRVTQTTYPDGLSESMTYDQAGRVLTKINRNGQTAYSYCDSSGRLFRLKTLNDTISYMFDADGKTVKIKNTLATIYCFYNSRDLMSSMAENIISNHTISYTYDADGKLRNITYPNSIKITYGYDAFDRAIKVDKNVSTRLLTVYYNKDDTISKESTGSVQVTNYTYNTRGFVSQIQTKNGSRFVLSMNYTYDKVGNVRNISYTSSSYENYTYDWLNRLTQAKGAGTSTWGNTIKYGYDSMGNRLWKNENSINTTYSYGAYNKLVKNTTSGIDTNWSYNKNGALLWKNTTNSKYQYAFNSMDQLTDVYKWTGSTRSLAASYYYDANGARAKTVEGSKTTEYVYNGHDPICDKLNGTYTDYVYFNGRLKVKMIGSDSYWYIDDALGSTRLVYKGTVKVYSVTTYKPFGIAFGASGTEKFTFAGEMQDSPSGLFYVFARYFDSQIGRFVSLDIRFGEVDNPQTINRYIYCGNNPIRFVDPTGEGWFDGICTWVSENWVTIVEVAACAVITVCVPGVGGVIACGLLSGSIKAMDAAYNDEDILTSFAVGFVTGAVSAGIGKGVTKVAEKFLLKSFSPALQKFTDFVSYSKQFGVKLTKDELFAEAVKYGVTLEELLLYSTAIIEIDFQVADLINGAAGMMQNALENPGTSLQSPSSEITYDVSGMAMRTGEVHDYSKVSVYAMKKSFG